MTSPDRVAVVNHRLSAGRARPGIVAACALVSLLALAGCAKGQHMDTAANATVLRTTRLAGYPAAQVGVDRARAALSLVLPSVTSAADIELAWQTGMAILTEAYPESPLYRIVIRTRDRTLLSAEAVGSAVVDAVAHDDPVELKDATTFILLADVEEPARLLPEESVSTTSQAAQLDAANRAAGLETTAGPAVKDAQALSTAWKTAYTRAQGVPAPTGGAGEAASFASKRIAVALGKHSIDGDHALEKVIPTLVASADVGVLRQWAATTEAVASKTSLGSVLELTAAATREVASSNPAGTAPEGPIVALERVPSLDANVKGGASTIGFVGEVLVRYGVSRGARRGLAYRPQGSASEVVAAPGAWLAYRTSTGLVYWLAGEDGVVALTDTSLRGWGYQLGSASLVNSADIRQVVATFPASD